MDGRLLLVAGLFGLAFAAGVGHAVASGPVDPVSQVVDEAVEASGVGPATPDDATDRAGTPDGENDDDGSGGSASVRETDDGTDDAGSSGDGGTAGESTAGGSASSAGATESASAGPPFRFEIESIETCGRTCRDVTATLVNGRDEAASDLVVETAIYAGNDTNEGDRVWKGTERVGSLAADAEHTSTRQVKLGWGGGLAVKRADGWITVETTVETADRTVTLERQREVA